MTEERGILVRASLHRPVTMLMLILTVGVVGFIAYRTIPLQLAPPGIVDNNFTISIPVRDSTPEAVMEEVAIQSLLNKPPEGRDNTIFILGSY